MLGCSVKSPASAPAPGESLGNLHQRGEVALATLRQLARTASRAQPL